MAGAEHLFQTDRDSGPVWVPCSRNVSSLAAIPAFKLAIGNLSQHLNMMKQRRVLVSRKDGNNVYYRLAKPKMLKAFDLIRQILLEQMRRESVLVRHMERAQARS